jgi:transcriptional regulator with XRE-family HTH domain
VNVGQNVKRIREEQRYTQTEIARRCGVTPAAISGLEHGDFIPSTPLLVQLARALDVSVEEIVEGPVLHVRMPHDSIEVSDEVKKASVRLEKVRQILDARDAGKLDDVDADKEIQREYQQEDPAA